jgi:hypothetical protein
VQTKLTLSTSDGFSAEFASRLKGPADLLQEDKGGLSDVECPWLENLGGNVADNNLAGNAIKGGCFPATAMAWTDQSVSRICALVTR